MKRYVVETTIQVDDTGAVTVENSTTRPLVSSERGAKIPVTEVRLTPAPHRTTTAETTAPNFKAADHILRNWAIRLNADEVETVEFKLQFADGNTFAGQLRLVKEDVESGSILARHVRTFVRNQSDAESADATAFRHIADHYSFE